MGFCEVFIEFLGSVLWGFSGFFSGVSGGLYSFYRVYGRVLMVFLWGFYGVFLWGFLGFFCGFFCGIFMGFCVGLERASDWGGGKGGFGG